MIENQKHLHPSDSGVERRTWGARRAISNQGEAWAPPLPFGLIGLPGRR